MCLGNRALASINFLNQQYQALYGNAKSCTEHYGTGLRPQRSEVEYGTCLYEFYGPGKQAGRNPSKNDLSCWFSFAQAPKLEFVCNHEVILYFYTTDGSYILDVTKTSATKADNHEKLGKATLAFRFDFKTHNLEGIKHELIGTSTYSADLFILDVATAQLIPGLSVIPGVAEGDKERRYNALSHFFTKYYISLLRRAGHHVLHSLPDFDNLLSTSSHIDYSVISQTNSAVVSASSLYGIKVDSINTYLKGLWLQAASYIDEHGTYWSSNGKEEEGLAHYLAEYRGLWTVDGVDVGFHLHFGPLHVEALCKREVVLYVDIQDAFYYAGAKFDGKATYSFSDWKIALIISIDFVTDALGKKHLVIDLNSARFCEHLSTIKKSANVQIDIEVFNQIRETIIQYITKSYFYLVSTAGHTSIYRETVHTETTTTTTTTEEYIDSDSFYEGAVFDFDSSSSTSQTVINSEGEVDFGCTCTDITSCGHEGGYIYGQSGTATATTVFIRWGILEKHRITSTHSLSYDNTTSINQNSINISLKTAWQIAQKRVDALTKSKTQRAITWSSAEVEQQTCLAEYSVLNTGFGDEIFFSASFKTPMIQLVIDEQETGVVGKGQVILYLWLQDGFLKTLAPGKAFSKDRQELPFKDWHVAFTVDLKLQDSGNNLKELVLDFSTAKFNQDRSSVHGLLDGADYRLIRSKREALIFYLTKYYFPTLVRAGHHVLYTVTLTGLGKDRSEGEIATGLTSLTFQISPFLFPGAGGKFTYLEGLYGQYSLITARNSILFLGMTGNRPRPEPAYIYRSSGLNLTVGIGRDIAQGGIAISRKSFLDARLVKLFASLNKSTTILPSFSGINGNEWILKLTTWDKHEIKKTESAEYHGGTYIDPSTNSFEFNWINRDNWRYEHEGRTGTNGIYAVLCTTHNTLSVPAVLKRGALNITVRGNVIVELSYAGDSKGEVKSWSSSMKATWTSTIVLASDPRGGFSVTSSAKVVPAFTAPETASSYGLNISNSVFAQLRAQLPSVIEFGSIIDGLKSSLNGISSQFHSKNSQYIIANPTFSHHGDLLLELRFRQEGLQQVTRSYSAAAAATGLNRTESWFQSVKREVGEIVQSGLSIASAAETTSTTTETSTTKSSTIQRSSSSFEEKKLLSTEDVTAKTQANGKASGKPSAAKGNGVPTLPAEKA